MKTFRKTVSQGWIRAPCQHEEILQDQIFNKVVRGDKDVLEDIVKMRMHHMA